MSYTNPPYYISAYSLARKRGFTGTLDEWLESLTAFYIAKQAGYQGTAEQWVQRLNDPVPKFKIGTVTTLDGGSMATVELTGTQEEPVLNFGIPRGMDMADALAIAGGKMKGNINMDGYRVRGLPDPEAENDAVPKSFVTSYAVTMNVVTATMSSSGWSNQEQTVNVSGVLADENKQSIISVAAPTSLKAYLDNNVNLTAQGAGKLTFACDNVPTSDITVNILMLTKGG